MHGDGVDPGLIDPWRQLLGLGLGVSWLKSALLTLRAHDMPYTRGVGREPLPRGRLLPALALAGVVQVVLIEAFVLRWHELAAGTALLVGQALVRHVEQRQWTGDVVVRLGKYAPSSAVTLGYLVVLGLTGSEAAGWEAGAGVMGATLALAALAKWRAARWNWFKSAGMGLLVAERAYSGPAPLRALRRSVSRSRLVSAFCTQAGMVIEGAGVLYVFPQVRPLLAAIVVLLLVNFYVLLGYIEEEWMLALIAITALSTAA